MFDWCHSGLEGYCKSATTLLGEPDDATSWLAFCRDLLPDRTAKTLTRAWTLSNERQGRSCRQILFEQCWLGGRHAKHYIEEAEALARGKRPSNALATAGNDDSSRRSIISCISSEERKRIAISRCEEDAVEACVEHIVQLALDDSASSVAYVASLILLDNFPAGFFSFVVPAMERGFLSERYRASDVQQFILTLNGWTVPAHRALTLGSSNYEPLRAFLRCLVAGLIYGPSHSMALGRAWDVTQVYLEYDKPEALQGTTLRLTQVYDKHAQYTGYTELYRPSEVLFLGRSPNVADYLRRCEELFANEVGVLEEIRGREAVVFPIARHEAVSNVHGMLLNVGDTWHLYDLGSTNGTSIQAAEGVADVANVVEIRAGDCIRLGAPTRASDANVYWDAASLLVSLHVDLSKVLL